MRSEAKQKYASEALCEDCSLCDERYTKTWRPIITLLPVLWVGQAPGDTERSTGKPFSGTSGRHHWTLCKKAGMDKEQMPHTNLINCYPGRNPATGRDFPPSQEQIDCCEPRLKADIHSIKPKLIVALGGPASHSLTGIRKPMKSLRGHLNKLQARFEYDCPVYCCYHPEFSRTQRQWIDLCIKDYSEIPRILDGTFHKPKASGSIESNFLYDPSAKQLEEFLYQNRIYTCDLETTGLNKRKDKITGVGFTDVTSGETCALDLRDSEADPRWSVFKQFIEDPNCLKIWQNGSYDSGILRQSHNIQDKGFYYDTRLAEQLIHSDLPSDLQHMRALYTDVPPYKPGKKDMAKTALWSKEKLLSIVGLDAHTTYKVYEAQSSKLNKIEKALIENHLIPLVYALNNMEHRGILVDQNMLAALYAQIQPVIQEHEEYFWSKGVNVRSSVQMKKYFNLPNTQYDTIMAEAEKNPDPEFQMLMQHRKFSKQASTYLIGVYKRLEDGRIHTTFKPEGTGTGRLSSENPNLQNIPEPMKVIYLPDPNFVFVKGDYKQIELFVGAAIAYKISGQHRMLDDLMAGVDVHYIACQVCYPDVPLRFGTRDKDFTKAQVGPAKTVVFGTFYGRTTKSIAAQFGVTVRQAEIWQDRLINHYPELILYKRYCETMYRDKGYIESPFGRRRYIATINQGYNHPVQSGAGDITLGSIYRCDQANLLPAISVHDDITTQALRTSWKKHLKKFKEIMERPIPELDNIQPKADYFKGENYKDMEPIK